MLIITSYYDINNIIFISYSILFGTGISWKKSRLTWYR